MDGCDSYGQRKMGEYTDIGCSFYVKTGHHMITGRTCGLRRI